MKVGLSLSFCVKEIMQGKVELASVDCIISGTAIRTEEQFQKACNTYCETYWSKNPEQGKFIAKYLWDTKRIHQPRLDSDQDRLPSWHNNLMNQGVHWLQVWRP